MTEKNGIVAALAKVAGELAKHGIAKDRTNQSGQRFKFRGIDDVYGALSSLLAEHEVVIAPEVVDYQMDERAARSGGALYVARLTVRYTLWHSDGSSIMAQTCGEAFDSGDKATNKAMSAAYKYMAFQVFCIPVEGQEDADATTPEATKPKRKEVETFKNLKEALNGLYLVDIGTPAYVEWRARVKASRLSAADKEELNKAVLAKRDQSAQEAAGV